MILADEWTAQKRVPELAANLIAYNDGFDDNDKLLETAILLFNEKPSNGVNFCINNNIFSDEKDKHKAVSSFLLYGKGLSKFAIGEYLSEPNEYN